MKRKKLLETSNIDELFVLAEGHADDSEKLAVEPYSYWKSVMRVFFKKGSARIGIIVLIILILMAIFVPIISPYDSAYKVEGVAGSINNWKHLPPSSIHWFGCDTLGRDLFTNIFKGARLSLALALVISVINTIVGIIIGACWGYFKKIDPIMIEVRNFIGNIPGLLLYMLLLSILTQMNVNQWFAYIFTLTITGWLGMATFIRNQIIIINDREYNLASKSLGTSGKRIITHNLLPFVLPVIITNMSLAIPATVSLETSLSFFGLGLKSTDVAIGPMLTLGYGQWLAFPWELLFPALVLGLIVVSFYLIGLALSDALDPKTHR